MGRAAREKPARLGDKLVQVRSILELSQDGMIRRLGLEHRLTREDISKYERGIREPSLPTLLRYAYVFGISTDVLIDDALDLPAKPPSATKLAIIKRPSNAGKRKQA